MGQYYRPTSIDNMEQLYSHDFDSGLKLMEHSWIGNNFVTAVEKLLSPGGQWHKHRFVWAGDYADDEEIEGEDGEIEVGPNFYTNPECETIHPNLSAEDGWLEEAHPRYVVDHDLREYVDKTLVPTVHKWGSDWAVHPLPLLTADGCGRGGGDFRGGDPDGLIGRWAKNRISCEHEVPEGYDEIVFNLMEST